MGGLLEALLVAFFLQGYHFGEVQSSHYRGLTISWKATEYESQVDVEWRFWYHHTSPNNVCDNSYIAGTLIDTGEYLECEQCSQSRIARIEYQCTDHSLAEEWQTGVGHTRFTIEPGLTTFDIRYSGCCWLPLGNAGKVYSAQAHVDLTPHDGVINSSPVTSWVPVVRIQQGCKDTLRIPVVDPDGDVVKCRWPSSSAEGGSVTPMKNAILDQSNCVLSINAIDDSGWYAIALIIEDFTTQASPTAKSKVPLQFLVNIYVGDTLTCAPLPRLDDRFSPTPTHSQCYNLVPGATTFKFEIGVFEADAPITALETTSPVGMKTTPVISSDNGSVDRLFVSKWIPDTSQIGPHIMCFNALDSNGQRSEVKCVILLVGDVLQAEQGWYESQQGEEYVLLNEGVVSEPRSCSLPSAALNNPNILRARDRSLHIAISPPVVVEAWTNATVNLPGYILIWNFRFDQDVSILGTEITKASSFRKPYAKFYYSNGKWQLSIPTWLPYNIRYPAPDTLQVLVRPYVGSLFPPIGQAHYVLLDGGAVNGPGPCHLPSAAVSDPYLCRAVYGTLPSATDETSIYTTPLLEDWTTSPQSDSSVQKPTQLTTEETGGPAHPPGMTQPLLSPSVDCSDSGMMVFIPRSVIGDALASHLHLLDPACVGSHHNATHVKIGTTYDRCGTFMEVRGDSVLFFNVIHDEAVPVEPGSVITRDRDIEIPVQCIMDLEGIAEISFRPDTSKITFREDGFGSFNFSLRLYHGNDYTTPYQPADYPVDVAMGNKLYFEARTWSEPGLELFLQTCRATPTSNPDDFHRYTFIQDGCIEDNTVVFHPSDDPDIDRFEIDAFAFVDALPQPVVYVHCDMVLCNSTDAYSRCAIGCPTRSINLLPGVHRRHARSASGSRAYAITQGPISVMEDGEEEGSELSSVQLPILLTTVCLLVGCVLVLGTLIVVMRKRTQRLQLYSPLATEEN
ncbi:uncharacterized protein LOC119733066 [Patiria miniata]|uniref:ZP domain-containing protein n=1 Tax=Patiria miniata TaxID=46514 RepID=A0A914AF29_PATMI|nr:uncharacterized protein LOC119733066 [Patiria miniata]